MSFVFKRKVQKLPTKNTFLVCIPQAIVSFLGIDKGKKLIFKNEKDRIYIEKES